MAFVRCRMIYWDLRMHASSSRRQSMPEPGFRVVQARHLLLGQQVVQVQVQPLPKWQG